MPIFMYDKDGRYVVETLGKVRVQCDMIELGENFDAMLMARGRSCYP